MENEKPCPFTNIGIRVGLSNCRLFGYLYHRSLYIGFSIIESFIKIGPFFNVYRPGSTAKYIESVPKLIPLRPINHHQKVEVY
jgi:hypothetical protein